MGLINATLNQLAFLFGFILIGFFLAKVKAVPDNAATALSKLENNLFIPCLVMGTFIDNFTPEVLSSAGSLLLISSVLVLATVPISILISKLASKDRYRQNIYIYGLVFANFGFMGNAVVNSLFPDIFFEYLIFTLPFWILIYLWGVPVVLMGGDGEKATLKQRLKSFVNPMFIGMILGMAIGLLQIPVPAFLRNIISTSGSCMSPLAMLLTGMVVSTISLKKTFLTPRFYIISLIRLLFFPALLLAVSAFLELPRAAFICALCTQAMPLGLNTIVIPQAIGKDASEGAGLAVISHLLSAITIPLLFSLL